MVRVLEVEPLERGAVRAGHLAAVVDRLVARASRKIAPAPASSGITDMWMCVIVGSTSVSSRRAGR